MNNSNNVLFLAVKQGDLEKFQNLLDDPEIRFNIYSNVLEGNNRGTVLHQEASEGCFEMVKLLLESDADVSDTDCFEWTPLHSAVHMNRSEVVKILIIYGADASAKPEETPLMVAAGFIRRKSPCQREMFLLLIDSGARVNDKYYSGTTALHMAA